MKKLPEIYFKQNFGPSSNIQVISLDYLQQQFEQPLDHDPFQPHRLKFNSMFLITDGKQGIHKIDFEEHQYESGSMMLVLQDVDGRVHFWSNVTPIMST